MLISSNTESDRPDRDKYRAGRLGKRGHNTKAVQEKQGGTNSPRTERLLTAEEVCGKKDLERNSPLVSQHPDLQDALTLVSKTYLEKKKKKE